MVEAKGFQMQDATAGQQGISLPEIISALSFALDLTEGAVHGHAVRSCLLGMRIARAAGLAGEEVFDLYYSLLLKDAGCSSNAARMSQIVGGDDRAMKAGVKMVDWTKRRRPTPDMLHLLWHNVRPEANAIQRMAHIVKMGSQKGNSEIMISLRGDHGASIMRKLGFTERAARAVRGLDEHWDGGGFPDRLQGAEIPLLARIISVAQHLDVFGTGENPDLAISVMRTRSGRWFDPELVRVAASLHRAGKLWQNCLPGDDDMQTRRAVVDLVPGGNHFLNRERIDQICQAFADVIDAKSPYTYRHSLGVTEAALVIAKTMGLAPDRVDLVRRAALLHDIGKLGVSNSILDKRGKLTPEEWTLMKQHSAQTRRILERVSAFEELAIVASEHHERLDGSGYPHGLKAGSLRLESRLIAVADVYGALSEDRPYRPGLTIDEVATEMSRDLPHKLDADCYEALMEGLRGVPERCSVLVDEAPQFA